MVQLFSRRCLPSAHLRWWAGDWCHLQHRCNSMLRSVHYTYLHQSLLRWQQVQTRTVELGKVQHSNRMYRKCIRGVDGADSLSTECYWQESGCGFDELHLSCLWCSYGESPNLLPYFILRC